MAPAPGPVTPAERALIAVTVLLNSAVSTAGWLLWRAGWIRLSPVTGPRAVVELVLLTLVMDALMYAGHWIAHRRRVYPMVHEVHHRHPDPRPATLFVMHPLEVLGFSGAWLAVLCVRGVYHAVSDEQRAAVVAAHPRPDFKNRILAAFTEGVRSRPDTTFGNVKADVLAHFGPGFERGTSSRWSRGPTGWSDARRSVVGRYEGVPGERPVPPPPAEG
ncbi:sterol desaturase family protein, partial [Kitasatospora sp. NPDC058190]|uniref:sterol desaturase family protein n=1 Tax=Kitasatospora sp. NPDC058190 TaxID=3346371 RepID=UPI0036DD5C9D